MICMTSIIQKVWHKEKSLHVHGWVYNMAEGLINDLKIDIEKDCKEFNIYDYSDESLSNKGAKGRPRS